MIEHIERKIRQIRELRGYSQEYMAAQLNLSTRAYSKIESGETQLTINRLNEICKILNVSPQELLGFDAKIIFNNNLTEQKGGKFIAYNNTEIKQIQELYERLLEEKDYIIKEKDKRINLLEKMLEQNTANVGK